MPKIDSKIAKNEECEDTNYSSANYELVPSEPTTRPFILFLLLSYQLRSYVVVVS